MFHFSFSPRLLGNSSLNPKLIDGFSMMSCELWGLTQLFDSQLGLLSLTLLICERGITLTQGYGNDGVRGCVGDSWDIVDAQ